MALKYASTPQLSYNTGYVSRFDDVMSRFPAGAKPISVAPTATSAPITVFEPDGKGHRAIFHRGRWMKLQPVRDAYSGETHLKMDSMQIVHNPVMWTSS